MWPPSLSKKDFSVIALAVIWFLISAYTTWLHQEYYLWDFRVYYFAGEAFNRGLDPYNPQIVPAHLFAWSRNYAYPPHTLPIVGWLAKLPLYMAQTVDVISKVVALGWLGFFWAKHFLAREWRPWFPLFCVLAYIGATHLDLRCGQVSCFEQVFLWGGFYYYLKKRYKLFCLLIFIASFWKLTPLFFLSLLLFTSSPRRVLYFVSTLGASALLLFGEYLLCPSLFSGFLNNNSTRLLEISSSSPSLFGLVRDLVSKLSSGLVGPVYVGLAVTIVGISVRAVQKISERYEAQEKSKLLVFLACMTYVLVLPRVADYYYVILLVPTYFIMTRNVIKSSLPLLFLAVLLPPSRVEQTAPGFFGVYDLVWTFYPYFVALASWILYLVWIERPLDRIKSA